MEKRIIANLNVRCVKAGEPHLLFLSTLLSGGNTSCVNTRGNTTCVNTRGNTCRGRASAFLALFATYA